MIEGMLIAAGGLILATLVLALATLGWRGSPVYIRLEGLAARAIIPATCFLIGLVLGTSYEPPSSNVFVLIGVMAAPTYLWGSLYLWRALARELQRDEPKDAIVEDGTTKGERQNLEKGSD